MLVPDLSAGWAAREQVTAAKLDAYTVDVWNFLRKVPHCVINQNTGQAVNNNTVTAYTWTGATATRDTDGMATCSGTTAITIVTPGIYVVSASVFFPNVGGTPGAAAARVVPSNGAAALEGIDWLVYGIPDVGGQESRIQVTRHVSCPVGGKLGIDVSQVKSTGAGTSNATATITALWVGQI